jgi:membrane protein DedA with SNARE-associated domain
LLGRFIVSLEHLLQIYGYPVLFVATFLEGETALLVAGFLAHRGYLAFPWVVLVAFAGTFSADQFFFYLGRSRGRMYLSRRPAWQAKADRANALLQRYGLPIVVGFRFLYGLRIVTPLVVGMSGFSPIRFVLLNAGGGALWSIVIAFFGYSLGNVLTVFLADFRHYETPVIISILLASAIVWLVYLRCRSGAQRNQRGPTSG